MAERPTQIVMVGGGFGGVYTALELQRNFSGFVAWWLWRTIYLSKLPRLEKKVRVALDWTLDLVFSKDLVKFETATGMTISHADAAHDAPAAAAIVSSRTTVPADVPRGASPRAAAHG